MGNAGSATAPEQAKKLEEADAGGEGGAPPSTVRFFPAAAQHTARQPPPIKLEEEDLPPPPATVGEGVEEDMAAPRNLWQQIDPSMKSVGINYPYVRRRKKLPHPVEKEKGVSLWSMIKDNIGKDLTKVCLPVYFNEPLSSLQKCFVDLEYSYLIDRAYEWGKRGDSLMRILSVAAFAVSGYASTDGRSCKPFNPLLGETYEGDYPDKGLRFFSEKVIHHPMVVACHCEGNGWRFWADSNLKSKFWGCSIQLDPVGVLTLEFDDGEVFQWSKVLLPMTTSIYNIILGKLYCDHYGTMRIQGNREYSCKLKFKEQSIIDRNPHQVQGVIQDRSGRTVATLFGKWDESMHYVMVDCFGKGKGSENFSEAHLLWKRSKPPKFPTRYNFTSFAITLNELTPGLKVRVLALGAYVQML
ncbi:oxysterol-binding protein-related protein 1C-like [Hordeum vulgare subsp. vulgare]|uniref:oxysterol-binding protein-related protein 1C-like n=1 Tax=Hordeum vulgare subsp. vulgare TaxID=112509 RepID=UPI001D1A57C7|nr:oxysterol-binding protein-related protein 1C-like [Hordeum vulgare subsp. vulgare]